MTDGCMLSTQSSTYNDTSQQTRCRLLFTTFHSSPVAQVSRICGISPVVKEVLWSRGANLTKPGWNKPHTHSNPTNLALVRHKITLYRFNQGDSYYCRRAQMRAGGLSPPSPLTLTTGSYSWGPLLCTEPYQINRGPTIDNPSGLPLCCQLLL